VVGRTQLPETWSEAETAVARGWRLLNGFSVADVVEHIEVSHRHVRRVLDEFAATGYVQRTETGSGQANRYTSLDEPRTGEVALLDRGDVVSRADVAG
jgi:predicted transcriptional regulator of viral defense system